MKEGSLDVFQVQVQYTKSIQIQEGSPRIFQGQVQQIIKLIGIQ